jgi:hypothetical protein
MQTYESIKELLTESEQAAVEVLIRAGWIPFADAVIEQGMTEGYKYPTYSIGGRYQFCLTANDLQNRQPPPQKKRGRPKKL